MRKTLISIALISSALAAMPAAAQVYERGYGNDRGYGNVDRGYGYNNQNGNFRQRIERIENRIERGIQRRAIDRREAWQLRRDLNQVALLEQRFRRDGLSRWEGQELDRRLTALQQRLRYARNDGWDRSDGQYDRGYGDNDRRGYGNRGYDRDDDDD